MKRRSPFMPLSWASLAVLLAVMLFVPYGMQARQVPAVADFAPPLSAEQADARVRAAQQLQAQQRAANLGVISPDLLPLSPTLFVAQTGHHLSDRAGFLTFWRENGGALIFGMPISEEIVEDGQIVQYFERARFEYHPEQAKKDAQVQLSLLGRELSAGQSFPDAVAGTDTMYFSETKHNLSGKFLQFWLKRGGLPVFGYPISEPIDEPGADGQPLRVQYFERARFEYHPGELGQFYREQEQWRGILLAGLHEVQLSDLGNQAAKGKGYTFAPLQQLTGALAWAPNDWTRRIDVDLSAQQLVAYEGDTPIYHAPVATGKDGFNTPVGTFAIYSKYPVEDMAGSAGGETWYVPNIPWVQYVVGGVALHGTYWHDQWGTGVRMSHGCINLNIDDAEWLYEWADVGTTVQIHY